MFFSPFISFQKGLLQLSSVSLVCVSLYSVGDIVDESQAEAISISYL